MHGDKYLSKICRKTICRGTNNNNKTTIVIKGVSRKKNYKYLEGKSKPWAYPRLAQEEGLFVARRIGSFLGSFWKCLFTNSLLLIVMHRHNSPRPL